MNMNTKAKKILVMMSTFNGENHLSEQIDSILNQKTIHEVHLLIRDDGSTDGTCRIIKDYVSNYPDKIKLIEGANVGYNASFFSLIHLAEGYDYYSISDQDDVWMEDKLQIACDYIDRAENDVPLLYASPSLLVHDDLIPYGMTRKKERPMTMFNTIIQNICPGHTQVMNSYLIEMLRDGVDTSRLYVYDSWIQNVANLYGKILYDNEPHTLYRQYDGNQLGSGSGKIGQMKASISRNESGDGHKYRKQIEYFVEKNGEELIKQGCYDELYKFVDANSFIKKITFLFHSKLYRQSRMETILFNIAVLTGKY